ncbi:MAG: DegT/DnrJ/EryC1/StrS family aminotransferase [Dehalococcoidia bacterium]
MFIELVDLQRQYQPLRERIMSQIEQVLSDINLLRGENVYRLEEEFAEYCSSRYAIGVGSGTDALHLALRAAGVGPGDEVITVSLTFIATIEAIVLTGACPVLVDIDRATYTVEPSQIESAITPRTKAIVPVHLYGHPCDMDPIMDVGRKHEIRVIEDACQAHGAEYKGAKVGGIGAAAAFSFSYSENLGGYGEGGMVVTKDRGIATMVQMLRNHGAKEGTRHVLLGTNSTLDEIQAAILRIKLPYLDRWNAARRTWAEEYTRHLADLEEVIAPAEQPYAKHVYHRYVIRLPHRDGLRRWLKSHHVSTAIHYPTPVHFQEACEIFGYSPGSLPQTEAASREIVSLPMYPELTLDEISYVCQAIRDYLRRSRGGRPQPAPSLSVAQRRAR